MLAGLVDAERLRAPAAAVGGALTGSRRIGGMGGLVVRATGLADEADGFVGEARAEVEAAGRDTPVEDDETLRPVTDAERDVGTVGLMGDVGFAVANRVAPAADEADALLPVADADLDAGAEGCADGDGVGLKGWRVALIAARPATRGLNPGRTMGAGGRDVSAGQITLIAVAVGSGKSGSLVVGGAIASQCTGAGA
jgi:hypothetical protein